MRECPTLPAEPSENFSMWDIVGELPIMSNPEEMFDINAPTGAGSFEDSSSSVETAKDVEGSQGKSPMSFNHLNQMMKIIHG